MALKTEEMVLNVGPQHPSTHGVLRLQVVTDGELIVDTEPHIGYLHRCFEKHCESMNYQQVIPYVDRMDYISSMNNNFGWVAGVERLMGLEVNDRTEQIRVAMAELNRIASHLLFFGTYGMDLGAGTPFLWCFRDREEILNIFEEVSGARLLYNYFRVGGLAYDLTPGLRERILTFLERQLEPTLDELDDLLTWNKIFVERGANVGVISREDALSWAMSGPMLRGSGVDWDIRRDDTYSIYSKLKFEVPTGSGEVGTTGDCWDRYIVRRREVNQSISLVRQVLENLPEGDVMADIPRNVRPPEGELYMRTEAPRGELGYYIKSDGSANPFRVKARGPSFCNLSIMNHVTKNVLLSDLIAILGSTDIVLGEIDR
jgi:NADH-quinone oxidoreductase subunit D